MTMHILRLTILCSLLFSSYGCSDPTPDIDATVTVNQAGPSNDFTVDDDTRGSPDTAAEQPGAPADDIALSSEDEKALDDYIQTNLLPGTWTEDLDFMVKRRLIRVLTVYGIGRYYLDGAQEKGLTYEIVKKFEQHLNDQAKTGHTKIHVVFIPMARDQLIPALLAGKGDLIVAGMSITPQRKQEVDFSIPSSKPIDEIMVTGPAAETLNKIEDLSGKTVFLRHSSSYRESVDALNKRLVENGQEKVNIADVSELLEDDDLIEMVNSGLLPWAIVDGYKTQLWDNVFDELTVRDDLVFRSGGRIAWAMRKDSPKLMDSTNAFLKKNRQGTLMGNILSNRYIRDYDWAANALAQQDYSRFEKLRDIFQKYGQQYGLDYLMIAAQGYQESRLDQSVRSSAGAVGVMQLLPSTAKDKSVGIPNIHDVDANIHAGVKYMSYLRERYFSDPKIDERNQTLLALGAYNAGPSRMINLRRKAEKQGYDPNVWFDNVEMIAAQDIGRETVQYVANIYKYYVSYSLSIQQILLRERAKEDIMKDAE